MKKLFEGADRYAAGSTWKDFAAVKLCLFSLGLMAGLFLPQRVRKAALRTASGLFILTYIGLMVKFICVLTNHLFWVREET